MKRIEIKKNSKSYIIGVIYHNCLNVYNIKHNNRLKEVITRNIDNKKLNFNIKSSKSKIELNINISRNFIDIEMKKVIKSLDYKPRVLRF